MRFNAYCLAVSFGLPLAALPIPTLATDTSPVYSAAEVAWSKPYGPNIIDGIGLLAASGEVKTCAGEDVYLRPRSALEDHRNNAIYGSLVWARISADKFMSAINPETPRMAVPPKAYEADARQARCSIDGKFLFTGLPDGEYYATVMIIPRESLGKPVSIADVEVVMRHITVAGGGIAKVDLFAAS